MGKFDIDDLVKINGFCEIFRVVDKEQDTFLGHEDMMFYDLRSVETGHIVRTYEHNIEKVL